MQVIGYGDSSEAHAHHPTSMSVAPGWSARTSGIRQDDECKTRPLTREPTGEVPDQCRSVVETFCRHAVGKSEVFQSGAAPHEDGPGVFHSL
ncbi:hypothetical protein DEJ02_05675 [Curtobacterium sp. MCLR17_042]|nr:hypothetical protein DEJ02_05675 [Curtobacterium sp. MCLR17_042]